MKTFLSLIFSALALSASAQMPFITGMMAQSEPAAAAACDTSVLDYGSDTAAASDSMQYQYFLATRFQTPASPATMTICKATAFLSYTGTAGTRRIRVAIWSDESGTPAPASLVGSAGGWIDESTIPGTVTEITFNSGLSVTLDASTYYWVILERETMDGSANYPTLSLGAYSTSNYELHCNARPPVTWTTSANRHGRVRLYR